MIKIKTKVNKVSNWRSSGVSSCSVQHVQTSMIAWCTTCVFNKPYTHLEFCSQISFLSKSLSQAYRQPRRKGRDHGLHELLCSLLRCLLRPIVVRGLMGWYPRGRVLGLVQEKVWFMVGEENGVEDKAGEMRAQPREP